MVYRGTDLSKAATSSTTLDLWEDYYLRFPSIAKAEVRDGCHPMIKEHRKRADKGIVLTHGLTDSPYFMQAIASYFYHELGYNVYLPLLHGHGLKEPGGMRGVNLDIWKKNISFAVERAGQRSQQVNVGGLSTGAVLSLYLTLADSKFTRDLYLFSGALAIGRRFLQVLNPLRDLLLRSPLSGYLDGRCGHIGDNPYRYSRMNFRGALQLRLLQQQLQVMLADYKEQNPYPGRVFAAHSQRDVVAGFHGLERFRKKCKPENFNLFLLDKRFAVPHASVVLAENIYGPGGRVLERANPLFLDMMEAVADFQS